MIVFAHEDVRWHRRYSWGMGRRLLKWGRPPTLCIREVSRSIAFRPLRTRHDRHADWSTRAGGYRQCDIEARALVGPRVFLGARWGVWAFETLNEANTYYWKEEGVGRGISMQLFCIRDKLRELNEVPVPPRLFEAHPEMIFWRIAGRVLESKKTQQGRDERRRLLEKNGIREIGRWLEQRQRTGIRSDDLIDACACALAARDSTDTVPPGGGLTDRGVRAEIWY